MKTYKITKTNNAYQSRSNANYATGLTDEQAQLDFDSTERLYKKYGGVVIERTEDTLTVEDENGDNNITYRIEEEENNE